MAPSRRRPRPPHKTTRANLASKRPRPTMDLAWAADDKKNDPHENIESDSSDDDNQDDSYGQGSASDEEEEEGETLTEKKLRMARQYLERIDAKQSDDASSSSDEEGDEEEGQEDDYDRLGRKLQRERQKKEGSFERILADKVSRHVRSLSSKACSSSESATTATMSDWESHGLTHSLRGHNLTPTCVALSGDDKAVSGSKDHSVLLWDLEKQTKLATLCPQWEKSESSKKIRSAGQVLTVACSDDGHYAAIGKRNATVQIFDIRAKANGNLVKTFEGHKGPVTCLTFRSQSHQLFTGSSDRCIRHYNLDEMLYLETLYGHQFGVTDIDCHKKERPVSVGQDRTARSWKLAEDSHLIFRGGAKIQAADCVNVITDDWFLTGHQDGHLSLWMTDKKKAVASIEHAHGVEGGLSRSIASVASLRMSDLAATGSHDGFLRFWKAGTGRTIQERGLDSLFKIPIAGYINSIAVGPKAKFCVVAVGQEHRLGRWNRISKAKNRIAIVRLHDPDFIDSEVPDDRDVSAEDEDVLLDDHDQSSDSSSSSVYQS